MMFFMRDGWWTWFRRSFVSIGFLLFFGACTSPARHQSAQVAPPPPLDFYVTKSEAAEKLRGPTRIHIRRVGKEFQLTGDEKTTQVSVEWIEKVLYAATGIPFYGRYLPVKETHVERVGPQPKRRFTALERQRPVILRRIENLLSLYDRHRSKNAKSDRLMGRLQQLKRDCASQAKLLSVAESYLSVQGSVVESVLKSLSRQSLLEWDVTNSFEFNILAAWLRPSKLEGRFVRIPKGSFWMGSPPEEIGHEDDELRHQVSFVEDFEIQATELSQYEWFRVMGYNSTEVLGERDCVEDFYVFQGIHLCLNYPIGNTSFEDIELYLSRINGEHPSVRYRLPTESEWEYVARGGSDSAYFFGSSIEGLGAYAWTGEDGEKFSYQPRRIASKKPNAFGVYDILGNVWEWTEDWYGPYPTGPVSHPSGPPKGDRKVFRGGAIGVLPKVDLTGRGLFGVNIWEQFRSAHRDGNAPDFRSPGRGFRLVRKRNESAGEK